MDTVTEICWKVIDNAFHNYGCPEISTPVGKCDCVASQYLEGYFEIINLVKSVEPKLFEKKRSDQ